MRRPIHVLLLLLVASPAQAEQRLPAYVLQLPPTIEDLFIADTGNAAMYHYVRSGHSVRLSETVFVSIGQQGVGKRLPGDRKTPLGIYFVVDRLDTRRLHEKYGVMAFPLDYPNVRDRQLERSGDGIWLHGVQSGVGRRPALDTDGCLALPNDELERLGREFIPLTTPVIITRHLKWGDEVTLEQRRQELQERVALWAASYGSRNPTEHLALYADDFSYRGLSAAEWRGLRAQQDRTQPVTEAIASDLLLLADPEEAELYLSRFRFLLTSGDERLTTTKRLYWQRGSDGFLRIIAEDNG